MLNKGIALVKDTYKAYKRLEDLGQQMSVIATQEEMLSYRQALLDIREEMQNLQQALLEERHAKSKLEERKDGDEYVH